MTEDPIAGAELDAVLVGQYTNEDGQPAMRLTPKGEQVAHQAALGSEADTAR